jgi:nitroreductase
MPASTAQSAPHRHDEASDLLQARYRSSDPSVTEPWNPILATLLAHRSVRAYRSTPLPEGALEQIIAAAQSAPTWANLQAWSVVVIEDPARKAKLAQWFGGQKHVEQSPVFLVWIADLARLDALATERNVTLGAIPYLDALLIALGDAALAAQNAVVAAESLGLGTVYIGSVRNRFEDVSAELKLPPLAVPVFGLCLGFPDSTSTAAIKPRLEQEAIVHREYYSVENQKAPILRYDERLRDFQREQGLPTIGWIEQALNRLSTPASLNGREHLFDAIKARGLVQR